jgi:hypothetical protein
VLAVTQAMKDATAGATPGEQAAGGAE